MDKPESQANLRFTLYSLFAWLWAVSIIWHYMRPGHRHPVGWLDMLVVVAAILVLIRPQNCYFLLTTAVMSVVVFLMAQPSPSNHWMMQFLVNAALCLSFVTLMIKRRTLALSSSDWLDSFRPTVCLLVLMLYLFASLHKLNSGYFSEHSYALRLYSDIVHGEHMAAFAHLFPTDAALVAILPHLSIFVELAIPILLFFRPTRLAAILIGLSFHTFLSLKEYPPGTDFPTLLGAAYVLFLPASSIDLIRRSILDRYRSSRFYQPVKGLIAPSTLLAVIFLPAVFSLASQSSVDWFTFANLKSTHWAMYVAISFSLVAFLIYRLRSIQPDYSLRVLRGVRNPQFAVIVLAFLVGMSPYLGLRTSGAFTMFSNLETDGNYSNHFFMPPELQIFDYQKQVCVIETTASDIPLSALTGELLSYYKFRQLTRRNPEESISYTFDGARFELNRIADNPQLVEEPDWFERNYLTFLQSNWDDKTSYCDWRW